MDHKKEELRKKRYGQYFSGNKVAEMLVDMLPSGVCLKKAVDPMAGSGDMLRAVQNKYLDCEEMTGVEIDPLAASECRKTIQKADIYEEDAFKSNILIRTEWDLVITNPPYVRYQLLNTNDSIGLPTSEDIRSNLYHAVEKNEHISGDEKELMLKLIHSYSGLSDMAVPAWILCASLVRKGGYLAMVVPETWLNRDYALPIHYLLLKCFDILSIAKDIESTWFENASIRTCLVIARKREAMNTLKNHNGSTRYIEISGSLMGNRSIVEKLEYEGSISIEAFLRILRSEKNIKIQGCECRTVKTFRLFTKLMRTRSTISWVMAIDKTIDHSEDILPEELSHIFDSNVVCESLEKMGWNIGQGLRTGANEFFYGEIVAYDETRKTAEVQTRAWNGEIYKIPCKNLCLAIQNRNEISGLCIKKKDLKKCILYIQDSVRSDDYKLLAPSVKEKYTILDTETQNYIAKAEAYIDPKTGKKFKDYSAVKTNEKRVEDGFLRFWYKLPPLQKRHEPDLCISRLCGKSAECLFVQNEGLHPIVVDANFITLWNENKEEHLYAYALLNSTWFKCYMEFIGSRMGGGALKIEANHLRQVLFPQMNHNKKKKLSDLGKELSKNDCNADRIRMRIDYEMFSDYTMEKRNFIIDTMKEILTRKLTERGIV